MAKWLHDDVLKNGLQHIVDLAAGGKTIEQHVIKAYSAADSYTTVAGNSVMEVELQDTDMAWGAGTPSGLALTIAAKAGVSITANTGSSPDLHVAIVNATDEEVLLVTDETTNQEMTSGGTKDIPAWTIQCPLPT